MSPRATVEACANSDVEPALKRVGELISGKPRRDHTEHRHPLFSRWRSQDAHAELEKALVERAGEPTLLRADRVAVFGEKRRGSAEAGDARSVQRPGLVAVGTR
jgi:hypothetical protein